MCVCVRERGERVCVWRLELSCQQHGSSLHKLAPMRTLCACVCIRACTCECVFRSCEYMVCFIDVWNVSYDCGAICSKGRDRLQVCVCVCIFSMHERDCVIQQCVCMNFLHSLITCPNQQVVFFLCMWDIMRFQSWVPLWAKNITGNIFKQSFGSFGQASDM